MVIGNRLPGTLGVESRPLISVKRDPIVQPSPLLPQTPRCLKLHAAALFLQPLQGFSNFTASMVSFFGCDGGTVSRYSDSRSDHSNVSFIDNSFVRSMRK
jgi:hypothetical protein